MDKKIHDENLNDISNGSKIVSHGMKNCYFVLWLVVIFILLSGFIGWCYINTQKHEEILSKMLIQHKETILKEQCAMKIELEQLQTELNLWVITQKQSLDDLCERAKRDFLEDLNRRKTALPQKRESVRNWLFSVFSDLSEIRYGSFIAYNYNGFTGLRIEWDDKRKQPYVVATFVNTVKDVHIKIMAYDESGLHLGDANCYLAAETDALKETATNLFIAGVLATSGKSGSFIREVGQDIAEDIAVSEFERMGEVRAQSRNLKEYFQIRNVGIPKYYRIFMSLK